jgi:hypothetical protein
MEVVAPCASRRPLDFVEEKEHVGLDGRLTGDTGPLGRRPHAEIPLDRTLRINGVQANVVEARHRCMRIGLRLDLGPERCGQRCGG